MGGIVAKLVATIALASPASSALACPGSGLDHVAVLVENSDTVIRSLNAAFGVTAFPETMEMSDPGFGEIHLSYAPLGGGWIEFVQPVGSGPIADMLKRIGSGAIIELNFETDDLAKCGAWLAGRDIRMTDVNGQSYGSGEFGSVVEPYGLRFAYVDRAQTNGATVEFFQRTKKAEDYLRRRDAWLAALPEQPRISFQAVNVQVNDLGASTKAFALLGFAAREDTGFCEKQCRSTLIDSGAMKIRLYQWLNTSSDAANQMQADRATSLSVKHRASAGQAGVGEPMLPGLSVAAGGNQSDKQQPEAPANGLIVLLD